MHKIPDSAVEFAEQYLPARLADFGSVLKAQTAAGSGVLRVIGVGEWSYWIEEGQLRHQAGVVGEVLAQLTVKEQDFDPMVLRAVRRAAERGAHALEKSGSALALDDERAELIRSLRGHTLALALTDGGKEHRLYLTPGAGEPNLDEPDCVVHADLETIVAVEEQRADPMDMFFEKRLRIVGNANLAMALGGLFA